MTAFAMDKNFLQLIDSPIRPDFNQKSLDEMLNRLDYHYASLMDYMITPAALKYDELVLLRRRAAQPDSGSATFTRLQAQLRLAVELLRLGRRSEGYLLLAQIEERLAPMARTDNTRSAALVYRLWLALARAASGNTGIAQETALELARLCPDPKVGSRIVAFFCNLPE